MKPPKTMSSVTAASPPPTLVSWSVSSIPLKHCSQDTLRCNSDHTLSLRKSLPCLLKVSLTIMSLQEPAPTDLLPPALPCPPTHPLLITEV